MPRPGSLRPPREEVPEALGLLGEVVPAPRRAPLPLRSVRAPQRPTQSAVRAHAPPGGEPGHRPREPARGAPASALRPGRRLPARAPALCFPGCPCLVPPEPRVSQMGGRRVGRFCRVPARLCPCRRSPLPRSPFPGTDLAPAQLSGAAVRPVGARWPRRRPGAGPGWGPGKGVSLQQFRRPSLPLTRGFPRSVP